MVKSIVLFLAALGLWLSPAPAPAGACCGALEKALTEHAGCGSNCGCCCTDNADVCAIPESSEDAPADSCCSASAAPVDGSCCGDCTCLKRTDPPSAPAAPKAVTAQGQPARPDMVVSVILPVDDSAAALAAVGQRHRRAARWTGPPIYLVNDVFRI